MRSEEMPLEYLQRLERNDKALKVMQPTSGDSLKLYVYTGHITAVGVRKFLVFRSDFPDIPAVVRLNQAYSQFPFGNIPKNGVYFWLFENHDVDFNIQSTQTGVVTIENSPPFTI